jgi:hypothetical protein
MTQRSIRFFVVAGSLMLYIADHRASTRTGRFLANTQSNRAAALNLVTAQAPYRPAGDWSVLPRSFDRSRAIVGCHSAFLISAAA